MKFTKFDLVPLLYLQHKAYQLSPLYNYEITITKLEAACVIYAERRGQIIIDLV